MTAVERLVKFEVLGQEYSLYTESSDAELREVLDLVRDHVEHHSRSGRTVLPANKVAILTSLVMASKYVRLKNEFEEYRALHERQVSALADQLEGFLAAETE